MTGPAQMTITLPGNVQYFRSVRLSVGGLAALVGFDLAAIDDLRIGVDELCAALAEVGDGAELRLVIDVEVGASLRIEGRTKRAADWVDTDRLTFSRQILDVVADEFSFDLGDDEVCVWLSRSLVPMSADPPGP
jgi:serine/threonine-protein kinase RsbW